MSRYKQKNDKSERAIVLGRRTKKEIKVKEKMTALRFQTWKMAFKCRFVA